MSRLIDADKMIAWYKASFPFAPSEVRFSINDIEMNMLNIPEEESEFIYALRTALRYNGLNERVKEWIELEPNEYKLITFTNQYDWKNMDDGEAQLQLVWMICVLLFGDYGTSPRFGWIEDVKGFKEFCEKLAEDDEVEEW